MSSEKETIKRLLLRIESLERLTQQLLEEQNQESGLDYGWSGSLGHWYWDIPTNTVTFNPLKVEALGYHIDEFTDPIGYDFFTSKLHPDDYEPTMESMRRHLRGQLHVYEVEYRIMAKDGTYKWFYDRGAITKRDKAGKPLLLAGIVFDITERKQRETRLEAEKERLLQVSMTDEMTGLLNHRGIMVQLQGLVQQQQELSLLMLDIDDFKHINDTYGHLHGDEILKDLSQVILANIRPQDYVGRYGGEEFLIVLPDTTLQKARSIAERIRIAISKHVFEGDISMTVSGGVYEFQGAPIYDLIRQADINLYEAKRQGKNRIV